MLGTKKSSIFNQILTISKVIFIAVIIVVALCHFNKDNLTPFFLESYTSDSGTYYPGGLVGVFKGASIVFFAFLGFDLMSIFTEEAKNPQYTIPRAISMTIIVITIIYMMFCFSLYGIAHID